MHNKLLPILCGLSMLPGVAALAGSFTSDFSNPNQTGFTLTSNNATRPNGDTFTPVIADGHLILTYNENSEQGTIILPDLDAGAPIDGFTASFKLQIGPGSGSPADGTAFVFGAEVDDSSNFGEEGVGNGIIVSFDIYDNGGGEAPAVDVKFNGTTLGTTKYAKADMVTGVFEDVQIEVTRAGTITVSYKGKKLYDNLIIPDFGPMLGRFAIGARTGGENGNQWIDDLSITTTKSTSTAPKVTTQPQNVTANEGAPASFSIGFDGSAPLSFQWMKDGVAIANATNATYTLARTSYAANGAKFKCTVKNNISTATSSEAVLTVVQDTTAPVLVDATGSVTFKTVKVWFSEPVDAASAQTAGNYQLSGGVTISAAALSSPAGTTGDNIVILTTSQQPENTALTLTVNNVKDVPGNKIAANSVKGFTTFVWMPGQVLQEYWQNVSAATIAALTNDTRFPSQPSSSTLEPMFEYPPNGASTFSDYYGNKLSGWFTPPSTGNYVFFVNSDDPSSLYLSTDADPANMKLIAQESGWSNPRKWVSIGSGSIVEDKRSDLFSATEWPSGGTITLTAGKKYYMEALHTEGGGGDNVGATFIKAGAADPADDSAPALTGSVIGTYIDPNAELKWTKQPADQPGAVASAGISMLSQDFKTNDGGFTVVNTDPEPPGPWVYNSASGLWAADGSEDACTGPYNSQLNSPSYKLTQDGAVTLSFTHRYSFESDYYDAGQVRISINGGAFTNVDAANFSANGYAPSPVVGTGIAKGLRAFNADSPGYSDGQFVTSQVLLGTFSKNDNLVVQFVGAWDECSSAKHPNWEIKNLKMDLLPMIIQDFSKDNGNYTVENTTPAPPGPWSYVGTNGVWKADGSEDACTGPYNSKLTSPAYTVLQSDEVTLSFTHRYSFESDYYDAGQVRISVNGGAFTTVPAENFTANGYQPGDVAGTGILKGQKGFNGNSTGYTNGTFITSSAVLGTFVQGDKIAVQFVGAWDECSGQLKPSWAIKNVQLSFGKAAKASTFEAEAVASMHGNPLGVKYQWQRKDAANFVDIVGETGSTLRIFPTAADMAATFRVLASITGKSIVSDSAKLTTGGPAETPTIAIAAGGGKVTIQFTGTLQAASKVTGPYTNVQGATSPYTVPGGQAAAFYRSAQ